MPTASTFTLTDPGSTFVLPGSEPDVNYTTLRKRADWSRTYTWDFTDFAEIVAGETISTATVAAVTGLTIGATSIVGGTVRASIAGGTAGTEYRVTCVVTTSGGKTLSIVGIIDVIA